MQSTNRQYPIGKFNPPISFSQEIVKQWIEEIRILPERIKKLLAAHNNTNFLAQYRRESWNIAQVLYHITDSHTNSYMRFKWALTEERPIIKPYNEKRWISTPEVAMISVDQTLRDLESIQNRLYQISSNLNGVQLKREWVHPDGNEVYSLAKQIGMYAWHGNHHFEHIRIAIEDPYQAYNPIDCNFYDVLVLHAMRKTQLDLIENKVRKGKVIIRDLFTKNGEEFIVFTNGDEIRLDHVKNVIDGNSLIIEH